MQPLIDAKVCNICKELKSVSEFSPNKQCSLGVVGTCKPCANYRVSSWYIKNRRRRQDVANSKNQDRKQRAVNYFGGLCADCNQSFPNCVFQFHHLDPTQKDVNPSAAMQGSEETMWNELNKCVMLCANCHIMRHRLPSDSTDRKDSEHYATTI